VLAIALLSAVSISAARPVVRPIPVNFDIATVGQSRMEAGRKRWLPPRVDALPDDNDAPPMLRFKGTKVRLKVPL